MAAKPVPGSTSHNPPRINHLMRVIAPSSLLQRLYRRARGHQLPFLELPFTQLCLFWWSESSTCSSTWPHAHRSQYSSEKAQPISAPLGALRPAPSACDDHSSLPDPAPMCFHLGLRDTLNYSFLPLSDPLLWAGLCPPNSHMEALTPRDN